MGVNCSILIRVSHHVAGIAEPITELIYDLIELTNNVNVIPSLC